MKLLLITTLLLSLTGCAKRCDDLCRLTYVLKERGTLNVK